MPPAGRSGQHVVGGVVDALEHRCPPRPPTACPWGPHHARQDRAERSPSPPARSPASCTAAARSPTGCAWRCGNCATTSGTACSTRWRPRWATPPHCSTASSTPGSWRARTPGVDLLPVAGDLRSHCQPRLGQPLQRGRPLLPDRRPARRRPLRPPPAAGPGPGHRAGRGAPPTGRWRRSARHRRGVDRGAPPVEADPGSPPRTPGPGSPPRRPARRRHDRHPAALHRGPGPPANAPVHRHRPAELAADAVERAWAIARGDATPGWTVRRRRPRRRAARGRHPSGGRPGRGQRTQRPRPAPACRRVAPLGGAAALDALTEPPWRATRW